MSARKPKDFFFFKKPEKPKYVETWPNTGGQGLDSASLGQYDTVKWQKNGKESWLKLFFKKQKI